MKQGFFSCVFLNTQQHPKPIRLTIGLRVASDRWFIGRPYRRGIGIEEDLKSEVIIYSAIL